MARPARRRALILTCAATLVTGLALAVGAGSPAPVRVSPTTPPAEEHVEASASGAGTSPGSSVPDPVPPFANGEAAPGPDPRSSEGAADPVSDVKAAGLVLRQVFSSPTSVNRVSVRGAAGAPPAEAGVVTFSDGSSVALPAGAGSVTFPERTVTSAELVLDSARSEASVVWSVDRITATIPASGGFVVTPSASSNAGGVGALAFVDGNPVEGKAGNEWAPNPSDRSPWVTLSWTEPREITSAQILGPSATAFDPAYSAAASLYGTLVFDDGSRVAVSGIEGGDALPTTIAFAPRTTRSVTLELRTTIPQASPGLREFSVYPRGVTPPRWPAPSASYAVTSSPAGGCGADTTAIGSSPAQAVALVCPAVGAAVSGQFPLVVSAAPGAQLQALAYDPSSAAIREIGTATTDSRGRAVFSLDSTRLMAGPLGIAVRYRTAPPQGIDGESLTVQVVNRSGIPVVSASSAPSGKTLVWDEQFRSPLSVTSSGTGSVYGSTKPAYWGPSEFGSSIFTDPALGAGTLGVLDSEYLRIRNQPRGSVVDPYGWGRSSASGLLSSSKIGATGFAAQYGYFEARILGPAGTGSWPAFWMLNTESLTARDKTTSGEVDAVELYGHQPEASCHALHSFVSGADTESKRCFFPNGRTDWSMTWHVYAAQIEPGGARYFIDGQEVARLSGVSHSDEPFFFMLNLATGGGYPVKLDRTGGTIDMYVDWVRVYV